MARYSLFMLKMPLNPNQSIFLCIHVAFTGVLAWQCCHCTFVESVCPIQFHFLRCVWFCTCSAVHFLSTNPCYWWCLAPSPPFDNIESYGDCLEQGILSDLFYIGNVLHFQWAQLTKAFHTAWLGLEFVFLCFLGWMIYLYVCVCFV